MDINVPYNRYDDMITIKDNIINCANELNSTFDSKVNSVFTGKHSLDQLKGFYDGL